MLMAASKKAQAEEQAAAALRLRVLHGRSLRALTIKGGWLWLGACHASYRPHDMT